MRRKFWVIGRDWDTSEQVSVPLWADGVEEVIRDIRENCRLDPADVGQTVDIAEDRDGLRLLAEGIDVCKT